MLKHVLKSGAAGCFLTFAMAQTAHAQFGDILGEVIGDRAEQEVCSRFGGRDCNNNSNTANQPSTAESMIRVAQLTSQLNSAERTPSPSADQARLYDYSDNYTIQGGVAGAIVGAVVGCIVADFVLDSSCSEGAIYLAIPGAVVGGVVGGRIGDRQEVYRDREATLNTKLTTARADLDDARSTRVAAERVVQGYRSKFATLQAEYQRDSSRRSALEREIAYAVEDIEALTAARGAIDGQIEALEAAIASEQPSASELAESQRIIADLRAESSRMDTALQSLTGLVETVRV